LHVEDAVVDVLVRMQRVVVSEDDRGHYSLRR
jgi:hypothetical protein